MNTGATTSRPLAVKGLADLNRGLRQADRDVRLGVRKKQREVAEPVRSLAQQLAASQIRGLQPGDAWTGMRTGVSVNLIYVAPRRRGARVARRKRPNLGTLLMDRAMEPALMMYEGDIERRFEAMLDEVADDFNRDGRL